MKQFVTNQIDLPKMNHIYKQLDDFVFLWNKVISFRYKNEGNYLIYSILKD
jgi:hypothetical protein